MDGRAAPDVRTQGWGDDLRLPTFMNAAETASLFDAVDTHRRPPIPFQSKHLPALKRDVWFALQRPADKSRTGLLVLWPERKCCVYITSPPSPTITPRVALLRLRVDPQFLATGTGMTIFAATLSPATRKLWLEDVLLWKGRSVAAEESFMARWTLCAQWLEHYCMVDARLVSGLTIQMANWASLQSVNPEGVWEFQSNDPGRRRLLWIVRHRDSPALAGLSAPSTPASAIMVAAGAGAGAEPEPLTLPAAPLLEVGPLVAIATRSGGPDQWTLTAAEGVSLGRALIRTLAVSSALRCAKTDTVRLEVEWNSVFKKWEARGVAPAGAAASHSSFFAGHE